MGVDIGDLLEKRTVELSDLSHKVIAIDAYNILYQFLSIIRQRDGTPLTDSHGNVTSHLSGILYRMTNLVENEIKPVFVFDGKPPDMKLQTIGKRKEIRKNARVKWNEAKEKGLVEEAFKYAQASVKVNSDIVDDAKYLLELMGIPYVQAPSEGEAQAAYMVKKGDADIVGSQDYDAVLFGAPDVVRNLTITGKRKMPRKNIYVDVKPEIINLDETLQALGVERLQLIDIAICVGTDFNTGLAGIGPKKAIKLIKAHGDIESALAEIDRSIDNIGEIEEFFVNPPVTDEYTLEWKKPNKEKLIDFLCKEHDFSEERISKAAERLDAASGSRQQQTLDQWC
ncbi:MAG TPA: flap endonuclease-1 [Methanosarcinaceae archaeon]|nr:flap endonuclease-1 [Methanosarcinaceae archaeon]